MLGKLGKAIGVESALVKGAALLGKEGEALNIAVQAAKQNMKGITAALVNRTMENTMEASGVFDEVYQKKLAEGYSEKDARLAASQAGRDTWYQNSAMLLQDIPQYMFIFKAPGVLASEGKALEKMFSKSSLLDYGKTMLSEGGEEAYLWSEHLRRVSGKQLPGIFSCG